MDEIYNDGGLLADIFAPVGKAEKSEGGYILNGKWNFVSGVNYSEWVSLGAFTSLQRVTNVRTVSSMHARFRAGINSRLEFCRLRGSGSNSVIAKDLFVCGRYGYLF